MELDHLREYAVLANRRSFTAAARELNMTQSTLSKHIAGLEREFGVSLFERTGKGVVMTRAGEVLYEQAMAVSELVAKARRAVRCASNGAASVGFVEGARPDALLRSGVRDLADAFRLTAEEACALVMFLEESPIAAIGEELGIPRVEAADLLAGAYAKLGVQSKEAARSRAYSVLE